MTSPGSPVSLIKEKLLLSAADVMDELNKNPLLLELPIYDAVRSVCMDAMGSPDVLQQHMKKMQETTEMVVQFHARTHQKFGKELKEATAEVKVQKAATASVIDSWALAGRNKFDRADNFKQRQMNCR